MESRNIENKTESLGKLTRRTSSLSDSTRLEYKRLQEERALNQKLASTATCFVYSEDSDKVKQKPSMFTVADAMKVQNSEPEVTSFPFVDQDANSTGKTSESTENQGNLHGARLCMISAVTVIHLKRIAQRRAKNVRERSENTMTSLDDGQTLPKLDGSGVTHYEADSWSYLRKCRYLRGVEDEKELTVEEIFR